MSATDIFVYSEYIHVNNKHCIIFVDCRDIYMEHAQ